MRRIKSAPADLSLMVNRKKRNVESNLSSSVLLNSNTYQKIKHEKKIVKLLTEINNDISGQEDIIGKDTGYYMLLIGSFVNQNFRKKISFENIKEFIAEMLLRYIISHTMHFIVLNQYKIFDNILDNNIAIHKFIDYLHVFK